MNKIQLTIPTYRIEHAGKTVAAYADNFARYGHEVPIVVFDDSGHERSRKSADGLAELENPGGIFYVGPEEKAAFLQELKKKLGHAVDHKVVDQTFKPSYGGNRNFTIVYTLGGHFVSVDDDIRPHALIHRNPEELTYPEVAKGIFVSRKSDLYKKYDNDVIGAFMYFLGKRVADLTQSDITGTAVRDDMADFYTNMMLGRIEEGRSNVLSVVGGDVNPGATIKIAQTFRTGSYDVDAYDYAEEFLREGGPELLAVNDMSIKYVLKAFMPFVAQNNWRNDCGVSGYDNSDGLPPFLPTSLRCEDYGNRLWSQNHEIATAHVNAVQTHYRDPYNRESVPHDFHNEAHANYLKDVLRTHLEGTDKLTLRFGRNGAVTKKKAKELVSLAMRFHDDSLRRAGEDAAHRNDYLAFSSQFRRAYNGFDIDAFHKEMESRIRREIDVIIDTMGAWPVILEASSEIDKPVRRMA